MEDVVVDHTWSVHTISKFSTPLTEAWQKKLSSSSERENFYVRTEWLHCSKDVNKQTVESTNSSSKNLRILTYVDEAWSSEIILCRGDVQHFAFALIRGLKSSYQPVLNLLSKQTGCILKTFSFTSEDLAAALSKWSTELTSQTDASTKPKPTNLSFAVPEAVSNGQLSTLSLTVPPTAMTKFCHQIEVHRPKRQRLSLESTDESQILRGLKLFIQESFRINVQSFPLTKISCEVAALSSDGRLKPHGHLSATLTFVEETIRQRMAKACPDVESNHENVE